MSQPRTPAPDDAAPLLDWEDVGSRPRAAAFRRSLGELLFHPGRFFDKMATSGGLHEALTFFWILLAAAIVLSFPLALAWFGLTAPDPARVSAETYAWHLLLPRAAGFVTVLLPLALALAGVMMLVAGTIFHLGARCFEARGWEGSVSIWLYAKSAAAAPIVAAEAAACAGCIVGYLLTLAWPASRSAAVSVAWVAVPALGAAAVACGVVFFMVAAIRGCTRSFRLSGERGAAAALAGTLLAAMVWFAVLFGFWKRGLLGGLIAVASAAVGAAVLALIHRVSARRAGPGAA